jgi:hypothetical protein
MGLALDQYNKGEPRVLTKDVLQPRKAQAACEDLLFDRPDTRQGRVPLVIPKNPKPENKDDKYVDHDEHVSRLELAFEGTPTPTGRGTWHQGGGGGFDYYGSIPAWLQSSEYADAVNWWKVAEYSTLKPRMVPALAKTLKLRFEDRIGYPQAAAAARGKQEQHEIQAAWRWIDRNQKSRIAPLFRLDGPLMEADNSKPKPVRHRQFIQSAQALKDVLARHRASSQELNLVYVGPTLSNPCSNPAREPWEREPWVDDPWERLRARCPYKFVDTVGLRHDVLMLWDGSSLILRHRSSPNAYQIDADSLDVALAQARSEAPECFADDKPHRRRVDLLPAGTLTNLARNVQ